MIRLGLWVLGRKTTEMNHQTMWIFILIVSPHYHKMAAATTPESELHSKMERGRRKKSYVCPFSLNQETNPSLGQAQKAGDRMLILSLDLH